MGSKMTTDYCILPKTLLLALLSLSPFLPHPAHGQQPGGGGGLPSLPSLPSLPAPGPTVAAGAGAIGSLVMTPLRSAAAGTRFVGGAFQGTVNMSSGFLLNSVSPIPPHYVTL